MDMKEQHFSIEVELGGKRICVAARVSENSDVVLYTTEDKTMVRWHINLTFQR